MIYENCYDFVLDGYLSEEEVIEWVNGYVFNESETSDSNIKYGRYIDTVNGIEIYYDYGADYYFFCELTPQD